MFNRKTLLASAASAVMALTAGPSLAKTDNDDIDVTLIIHCCLGNVFWEPVILGAQEAAEKFGIILDIQNADSDPAMQVNLIEQAVANKQNAIVVMIAQADAMTAPLLAAREAGVYVVASNVDHPDGAASGTRAAYTGQDFVAAGRLIAERIIAEGGLVSGDTCVLPAEAPEQAHLAARGQGALEALTAAGITGEIIKSGDNVEEGLNIIAQYLLANPETDCVIGLGNTPTSVIPQAVEEAGLEPLPNGGFDVNPRIMENIVAGKTIATVDQQQYLQGFIAVTQLALWIRYGIAPADYDTSAGLIDINSAATATEFAGTYR